VLREGPRTRPFGESAGLKKENRSEEDLTVKSQKKVGSDRSRLRKVDDNTESHANLEEHPYGR